MHEYETRLRWTGGRGTARLHGVDVKLPRAPSLSTTGQVDSIDYAPEDGVAMVMERFSGWRDLTADEAQECWALLYEAHRTGES